MIRVEIYRNKDSCIYGFSITGHAEYATYGNDIVCSAVTALIFNAINSIEEFTLDPIEYGYENDGGYLTCLLPSLRDGEVSHDTSLLLNSMLFGLKGIQDEYCDFITITDKEV